MKLSFCSPTLIVCLLLNGYFSSLRAHSEAHASAHAHGKTKPLPHGIFSIDVTKQDSKNFHLLYARYDGQSQKPQLYHRHSQDAGHSWGEPVPVGQSQPHAHAANRGMDPQIAASKTHLIAAWMTPGTDAFGGGPLATAISTDQGKTWQPGPNPADDGRTDGHGFLDIAADADGHFHLVWLDNRSDKRGLRYAKSTDNGKTWSSNQTLDPDTCECCWNSIAIAQNSIAVLYRDQAPRDMKLRISRDLGQSWEKPITLGQFHWNLDVCPHVGGSLAMQGSQWHVVVWSGAEPKPGLYHLSSNDAGVHWSAPQFISDVSSTHPSIAMTDKGDLQIATTHLSEQGMRIQTFSSQDRGQIWHGPQITSKKNASASHPLLLASDMNFHLFWTEALPQRPQEMKIHNSLPPQH